MSEDKDEVIYMPDAADPLAWARRLRERSAPMICPSLDPTTFRCGDVLCGSYKKLCGYLEGQLEQMDKNYKMDGYL